MLVSIHRSKAINFASCVFCFRSGICVLTLSSSKLFSGISFCAMKGGWLVFVQVLFVTYLPSSLCLNKCTVVSLRYYILLAQWCIRFIAPSLIILFFCSFVHITLFLDDGDLSVPSLLTRYSFFILHRTN